MDWIAVLSLGGYDLAVFFLIGNTKQIACLFNKRPDSARLKQAIFLLAEDKEAEQKSLYPQI